MLFDGFGWSQTIFRGKLLDERDLRGVDYLQ